MPIYRIHISSHTFIHSSSEVNIGIETERVLCSTVQYSSKERYTVHTATTSNHHRWRQIGLIDDPEPSKSEESINAILHSPFKWPFAVPRWDWVCNSITSCCHRLSCSKSVELLPGGSGIPSKSCTGVSYSVEGWSIVSVHTENVSTTKFSNSRWDPTSKRDTPQGPYVQIENDNIWFDLPLSICVLPKVT